MDTTNDLIFYIINILIVIWGLYRIYNGINRIKFENLIDNRVNNIPDKDVKNLWYQLSDINHKLGTFYKFMWGPYLIVNGIFNMAIYFFLKPTLASIIIFSELVGVSKIYLLLIFLVLLFIGILLIGENDGRLNIGEGFPLSFEKQKKAIYYLYSGYEFSPRENWSNETVKDFSSSHAVHFERYKSGIDDYVKNINKAIIGIKIWYLTLIILFFIF